MSDSRTAAGSYSVGRVADLSGVTIRTLHHYDEIGLLSPGGRSDAGYRVYEDSDLERLQRILFYRELGFTLKEISTIIDDPGTDAMGHLRRQRGLLVREDRTLERDGRRHRLRNGGEKDEHTADAGGALRGFRGVPPRGPRRGGREALGRDRRYKESNRRVSKYTKEDWLTLKAEAEDVQNRLAAAFEAGLAPDSEEAMAAAEAHRQHISRWFYECTYEIHRGLTDMYVSDERFRSNYDTQTPGLAAYIKEAAHANAARAEKGDSR